MLATDSSQDGCGLPRIACGLSSAVNEKLCQCQQLVRIACASPATQVRLVNAPIDQHLWQCLYDHSMSARPDQPANDVLVLRVRIEWTDGIEQGPPRNERLNRKRHGQRISEQLFLVREFRHPEVAHVRE